MHLAGRKPPLEEVREVTGLAVPATLADDQWRRRRLQLHAGEPLAEAARNGQHVVRAVLTDGEALVFAEVPADLVGLYRVAGLQRRPQRTGSDALGLGCVDEFVDEFLSLTRFAALLSCRELGPSRGFFGA